MPYILYVLQCSDKTLYTGITTDIERRVREHNGEVPGGASYTHARRPVVLVYTEQCKDRSEASKREYAIKQLTRTQKIRLIETHHV